METKRKLRRQASFHLSKQEAYPIIEEYFRSGLLPKEFWTKVGWSDNQFYGWRKRYMEEHHLLSEDDAKLEFHAISLPASPPPLSTPASLADFQGAPLAVELTYPNGVVLKTVFKSAAHLQELVKIY